ncbi:MAG: ABC transporter ATP-binding protein, partial [Planctomycetes bacterium]|nr:ABC transporter ATP-binding protein [Planctomycetota bacterium]
MMIVSGLAEVVSLTAVVPFLTVLADPSRVWSQPGIHNWATRIGCSRPDDMAFPLTLAFVVATFISASLRLANLWLSGRVGAAVGSDIAHEAYRRTLYQPYSVHTARNSSTVITGVITHVNRLIHHIIYAGLQLVSCSIVVIGIAICLLVIDPTIALLSLAVFGSAYVAMSLRTKHRLLTLGATQAQCNQALLQTVQEGLGGIRDILLDHSQPFYIAKYRHSDNLLRQSEAESEFISGFPRFIIEGLGTAAIAVLAYLLVSRSDGIATALPILGACALGAQRLLPSIQQGYFSFSQLRSGMADLQAVVALLDQPASLIEPEPAKPLPFTNEIGLRSVSFRYAQPDSDCTPWILRRINLTISKGERVAIIGPTGSGKSTLVDLLMGLLEPTEGALLVDGKAPDRKSWQATIANVPQSIFLADTSIAENIALGIPFANIDQPRLRQAALRRIIHNPLKSLLRRFRSIRALTAALATACFANRIWVPVA